jgi:hypothetical protein
MRKVQRALALAGMAFVATATIGMSATSAFAAPGDHNGSHDGGNNGDHNGSHNGNNGGNNGSHNGGNNGDHNGHGNGDHNGHGNGDHNGHGNGNGNQDWGHNGHNGDHRWDPWGHDTAKIAGVFKSRNSCEVVGWIGEKADKWDSYDCDKVGKVYVLEVEKHFGDWHRHGRHH